MKLSSGQYELGDLYRRGLGVPQDYVLAHMWFNLAASCGVSGTDRDDIAAKMTQDQIAEAQRMAREWMQTLPYALVQGLSAEMTRRARKRDIRGCLISDFFNGIDVSRT